MLRLIHHNVSAVRGMVILTKCTGNHFATDCPRRLRAPPATKIIPQITDDIIYISKYAFEVYISYFQRWAVKSYKAN